MYWFCLDWLSGNCRQNYPQLRHHVPCRALTRDWKRTVRRIRAVEESVSQGKAGNMA